MQACPYDALYIDPKTHTAAKCNYCAHRVDVGLEPACVNVCPTQAIVSGDLDDPESRISKLKKEQKVTVRKGEKGTLPALYYINADEASLEPMATQTNDQFMWSQQQHGVGHFSHDASGDEHALEKLGRLLSFGESSNKLAENAQSIVGALSDQPRRAYDAPQKGILWGWQVSGYLWTKSIAAGIVMVVLLAKLISSNLANASLELFATVTGLVFLGLTGGLLVWDLDKPTRFLYVLLRPQWRSWLVRGAYIITAYATLLMLNGGLCWLDFGGSLHKLLAVPLLIGALFAAIYTAFLFAQAKGREFWQSKTVPLHMVTHSVINGAATLGLFAAFWDGSLGQFIRYILIIAALIHLVLTISELFLPHSHSEIQAVVNSIKSGRYSRLFWGLAIAVGTVLPTLLLIAIPISLLPIACLLFLLGVFASQHIWVRAPQQIPLS